MSEGVALLRTSYSAGNDERMLRRLITAYSQVHKGASVIDEHGSGREGSVYSLPCEKFCPWDLGGVSVVP